jgi:hypothetical protein
MFIFGSGVLIGTPSGVSNPTPVNVGLVQEVTIDQKRTLKEIYGQFADPQAIGAGTRKTTLKAKSARFSGLALATLLWGVQPSAGGDFMAFSSAASVPASSPYTITPTPPNSGTWKLDQGVIYAATGSPLKCVASVSAAGQYSVSAGVYTFYSGDEGAAVLISYIYTVTSATSQNILVPTPLIGPTVSVSANLYFTDPDTNQTGLLEIFKMVLSDLSFGTKLEDFAQPELSGSIYANAAGNLWQVNFPDTF